VSKKVENFRISVNVA